MARRPDHRREVVGEGRAWPRWSSTKASIRRLPAEPQDRLDHVRPVLAADPRRADDRRARGPSLAFACQLRRAVDRERRGRRPTRCRGSSSCRRRRSRSTRGRDGRRPTPQRSATMADSERVDGERPVRIGLASVDRGPRRAVHDRVGSGSRSRRRALRRDRSRRALACDAATTSLAERRQRTTSRPSWPPAPVTSTFIDAARAFSGSHHSRLSRYHATVARAPRRGRGSAPAQRTHLADASIE